MWAARWKVTIVAAIYAACLLAEGVFFSWGWLQKRPGCCNDCLLYKPHAPVRAEIRPAGRCTAGPAIDACAHAGPVAIIMSETKRPYWLGFDLGGSKMLAAVFDASFEVLGRERKKTKGHEGQQQVVSRLIKTIHDALDRAQITAAQLGGIGVGVPGPVDQDRGLVLEAVNLSWDHVPLGEILQREFSCAVLVTNDVDAGVYGEYRFGAAREAHTALGVFPGTGIGGGCVYNGEIVRGKNNSCMEIGHMQVTRDGRLCGCGLRGCLETEASRLAIAAEVATAAFRGETPHLMADGGTNLANLRSGALAKAIAAGDAVVEKIVRNAARRLGVAIATFVHLLSPDVIVLGGGLAEAMPDLYREAVAQSINNTVMPSFVDSFRVVIAQLGDDAAIMGAAAWAEKSLGS